MKHEFAPNPAVLDMNIRVQQTGMARRNQSAIEWGVNTLVLSIEKMRESDLQKISILPKYVIDAIRIASAGQLERLVRALSSCVYTANLPNQNASEMSISHDFVFAAYQKFYHQETPNMIHSRLENDRVAGIKHGIQFDTSEAHRVRLKDSCAHIVQNAPISDNIATIFGFGGRVKTIQTLSHMTQAPFGYDELRRNWGMYNGLRMKGNITKSIPDDQISTFVAYFEQTINEGKDPYSAAIAAYGEVVDIQDPTYTIDAFVHCLNDAAINYSKSEVM